MVLTNGQILAGTRGAIRRFNAHGSSDNTYNANFGVGTTNQSFVGLTLASDGGILLGDDRSPFGLQTIRSIRRLNPYETRDLEWPRLSASSGFRDQVTTRLAFSTGGKIFFAIASTGEGGPFRKCARYNLDASLDSSFDKRTGPNGDVTAIVPLRDGRVLIAGSFTTFDGVARLNLVRLVAANAPESQAPVIVSLTPEAASVLPGPSVALAVTASGTGPLTYRQSEAIPTTDTGKSVVAAPTDISGAYTATVTVSNRVGSVTSTPVRIVVAPSAPILTSLPANLTTPTGRTATLSITAAGNAPFSYQWSRGSTPVGTGSTLTLGGVTATAAGAYTVVVTNSLGSTRSLPMQLTVDGGARLTNIATRAGTGPGENTLTAGFVIAGAATKSVLVRGVGPGLAAFGLTGLLPNPKITLFDAAGKPIATSDDFVSSATPNGLVAAVNAFSLSNFRDAALVAALASGSYTVQLTDSEANSGVALVEVYEADDKLQPHRESLQPRLCGHRREHRHRRHLCAG